MHSPILALAKSIAACPYRVAPEVADELHALIQAKDIELIVSDDLGFDVEAVAHTGKITITVAALELFWASAFSGFVFYQEYVEANKASQASYAIGETERSRQAMNLLRWAVANAKKEIVEPWPMNLPQPNPNARALSDIDVANELFLCALAWALHHEISHVALSHSFATSPIDMTQEKAADIEATKRILVSAPDSQQRGKRALGMIAAIMALQYIDSTEAAQSPFRRLHPRAFERLAYCLDVHQWMPEDIPYAFSLALLQVFMAERNIQYELSGDSVADILNGFFVSLSGAL